MFLQQYSENGRRQSVPFPRWLQSRAEHLLEKDMLISSLHDCTVIFFAALIFSWDAYCATEWHVHCAPEYTETRISDRMNWKNILSSEGTFFLVFKLTGLSNYKPQWRHGPSDQDHMPVHSQSLSILSCSRTLSRIESEPFKLFDFTGNKDWKGRWYIWQALQLSTVCIAFWLLERDFHAAGEKCSMYLVLSSPCHFEKFPSRRTDCLLNVLW